MSRAFYVVCRKNCIGEHGFKPNLWLFLLPGGGLGVILNLYGFVFFNTRRFLYRAFSLGCSEYIVKTFKIVFLQKRMADVTGTNFVMPGTEVLLSLFK